MADCRSSSDSTERPLDQAQQPSRLERPVWIVERPLSAGERSTVDDPEQSVHTVKADARRRAPTTVRYAFRNSYFVGDASTGYPASFQAGKPPAK